MSLWYVIQKLVKTVFKSSLGKAARVIIVKIEFHALGKVKNLQEGGGWQPTEITLFTPHFYTTQYLAPKESENINGPISFVPSRNDSSNFVRPPNDQSKNFRPTLTQKLKVLKTPKKHK